MARGAQGLRGPALIERIRARGPEGIYLLHGKETWFVDRAIGLLKEAIFGGPGGEASRSLNFDSFAGREAKAGPVLTTCQSFPMFAARRLVIIRNASKANASEWDQISGYFSDPSETTTLLVEWGPAKPDGRKKWVKEANKNGAVAECRSLYEREVPSFVRHCADTRKVQLDPDAGDFLAMSVGTDLHALEDAVERLALYVGEGKRLRLSDVEECIANTREHELWDLTDAVGQRNLPGALAVLRRVRRQGTAPQRLTSSLQWTFRQLWQAREALASGASKDQLARALGIHPFVAGKVGERARRFSDDALATGLSEIADTEVAGRTGEFRGPNIDWILVERLVDRLCQPTEPR